MRINSYDLVPAMEDNGVVMYESPIINGHLEEAYPETPLLQKELGLRTHARILEDFRDNHLYPAMISRVTRGIDAKDWARAAIAAAFVSTAPMFQRLEDELAGKEFLAGSYSIVDIAFTPKLARQVELGVGLPEKYPRLRAWVERLMQDRAIEPLPSSFRSTEGIAWRGRHLSGACGYNVLWKVSCRNSK